MTNQDNVSSRKNFGLSEISPGNTTNKNTQASRRNGKNLTFMQGMAKTGLQENLGDNIFEIIDFYCSVHNIHLFKIAAHILKIRFRIVIS